MSSGCGWFPMEYDEIVAWVKAHDEVLSANLETISALPMPFRKVIVKMASEEHQIALWREQLAAATAADTTLTDEQRAFVAESVAALPEIFASRAVYTDWKNRTDQMFTPAQSFLIFEMMGPREPAGGLPLPADAKINTDAPSPAPD